MKAIPLKSSKGSAIVKKYVKAARSTQHMVLSNNEWAIKKSNSDRITKIFDSQRAAIAHAIKIAINQKSELVVYGKNGQIREKNSYGSDIFPPRG